MTFDQLADPSVEDLFPKDEEAHAKLLDRHDRKFTAAEAWRQAHEDRWSRLYKQSRSKAPEREQGNYASNVFVPMIFFTLQTILSRLISQLPEPVAEGVGEGDEEAAPEMENMLRWACEQTKLYLEVYQALDYSERYGTGIIKTRAGKKELVRRRKVPKMQPVYGPATPIMDPMTGEPETDIDGAPITGEPEVVGEKPVLGPDGTPEMEWELETVLQYVGPVGEHCDIFDIYPDPMATGVDDASYIIHRAYKPRDQVLQMFEGDTPFFRRPAYMSEDDLRSALDSKAQARMSSVGLGGGTTDNDDQVEVQECWYREGGQVYQLVVLNRRVIARYVASPFDHGELPFVRLVSVLMPDEFWGDTAVAHLEGPQDLVNAITNQRVDNIRIRMERPVIMAEGAIQDARQVSIGPGTTLEVNTQGRSVRDVIDVLDFGEINGSAYEEVQFWLDRGQEVSGVSDYTAGTDSASLNDTATGIALISEQGNTRFAMKTKLAEMTGMEDLYRQYAALIQQFTPEGFIMRIVGDDGVVSFKPVDPAVLVGAFDIKVAAESSTQTETMRKQSAEMLFDRALNSARPDGTAVFQIDTAARRYLRAYGIKDTQDNIAPDAMALQMQAMQAQMAAGGPLAAEGAIPEEAPAQLQAV